MVHTDFSDCNALPRNLKFDRGSGQVKNDQFAQKGDFPVSRRKELRDRFIISTAIQILMGTDEFPSPEIVLEMEPEQLAPFVLRKLQNTPEEQINRHNLTTPHVQKLQEELGHKKADRYARKLMEAWLWLERDMLIAPKPGTQDDWYYVTERGQKILSAEDFEAYKQASLFPAQGFDPILVKAVHILFLSGDYETAVFRAFKEVEMRVRDKSDLDASDIGVPLMRKAFGTGGPLEDVSLPPGERERMRELFTGAIGTFKNPASHRAVQFENPKEVIDIISFANHLLRIVERSS